jgi:AraC-like DNA-binding protein
MFVCSASVNICPVIEVYSNQYKMLIRDSISGYRHINLGNIKLAFTQVCKDEVFQDIYFAANSLYYVESGTAVLYAGDTPTTVVKGESALIRQHSKLDIQKFKDSDGQDFRSIIFYLFPDFVRAFVQQTRAVIVQSSVPDNSVIYLGEQREFTSFCESLLPLFDTPQSGSSALQQKTFEILRVLARRNRDFIGFLSSNADTVKIDLFEFMIHNVLSGYSVPELARLTGRSLSAFKRDFKAVFATTPHQWLLHQRIEYAEQLLKEKNMKASDIYLFLGFNELSHFSAAFKKQKGISPTQI